MDIAPAVECRRHDVAIYLYESWLSMGGGQVLAGIWMDIYVARGWVLRCLGT